MKKVIFSLVLIAGLGFYLACDDSSSDDGDDCEYPMTITETLSVSGSISRYDLGPIDKSSTHFYKISFSADGDYEIALKDLLGDCVWRLYEYTSVCWEDYDDSVDGSNQDDGGAGNEIKTVTGLEASKTYLLEVLHSGGSSVTSTTYDLTITKQ
jgi:hypothetical protein